MSVNIKRFYSLIRFFTFVLDEKIPILSKGEDGNYYVYCDPEDVAKLNDKVRAEFATVLADMHYNCRIEITIKSRDGKKLEPII